MAKVLEILKHGAQSLKEPSAFSKFDTKQDRERVQNLVEDMIVTLREAGGVGLAAPQVGVNERILLIEVDNNPRYSKMPNFELKVFVNPIIQKVSNKQGYFVEGCLSVPNEWIELKRPKWVKVSWQDQYGRPYTKKLTGVAARIFFHEYDHLEGLLISDFMEGYE
ncbi:MAG: peptide deformylase [Candidatus Cloacimonetes bacterium]|nr:peptide deformylase [Candidatus Cloacimonadota bacterium]MCO4791770.1 peptide deformylase [Flavobacteriales bacterium]